jgi:hypothetical protein
LQLAVRGRQLHRAPIKGYVEPMQVHFALLRGAMCFHNWCESLGKKKLRPLGQAI